jgi:hypothetical protein
VEIYIAECSHLEVEIVIAKFKGIDQILANLFQVGDKILNCKIHKLINSIWNTEELGSSVCLC